MVDNPKPGNNFIIIAITSPNLIDEEERRITSVIKNYKVDFVHIRKPDWTAKMITELIDKIPRELHNRLKLHDHFELLNIYNLGGVHLNSRNPVAPENCFSISKSFHSLEELENAPQFDYVTLSPIFDSISKKNYKAAFSFKELKEEISNYDNIIALGGITPDKFELLKNTGFHGAAMSGYFWK